MERQRLSSDYAPNPTTHMRKPLRLREVVLAAPQSAFRLLDRGDVRHRTNVFEAPWGAVRRARNDMEVLDGTVQHLQTMFKIKIRLFPGRVLENLPHPISIVGMNALRYQFRRWRNRLIVGKDVVGFLRPVNLSARNAPAKATGEAYALSLR